MPTLYIVGKKGVANGKTTVMPKKSSNNSTQVYTVRKQIVGLSVINIITVHGAAFVMRFNLLQKLSASTKGHAIHIRGGGSPMKYRTKFIY